MQRVASERADWSNVPHANAHATPADSALALGAAKHPAGRRAPAIGGGGGRRGGEPEAVLVAEAKALAARAVALDEHLRPEAPHAAARRGERHATAAPAGARVLRVAECTGGYTVQRSYFSYIIECTIHKSAH